MKAALAIIAGLAVMLAFAISDINRQNHKLDAQQEHLWEYDVQLNSVQNKLDHANRHLALLATNGITREDRIKIFTTGVAAGVVVKQQYPDMEPDKVLATAMVQRTKFNSELGLHVNTLDIGLDPTNP